MITGKDVYDVLAAIVPLYVAMILAYGSVRWWKIFTPDQCSGINRFVAVFAVPLLSFHFISCNNPYAMNYRFIAADSLQKLLILFALFLWQVLGKNGSLEWSITLFSLSTLPNTLVMGIPLLKAMYGDFSGTLMVQIVVLQSVIWYTLMLFMFEFRGAKLLISEQFPDTAASITSFRVDSDVVSLNGREALQADAEIGDDGKLHVVVRRSAATSTTARSGVSYKSNHYWNSSMMMTPRASNLTGVEIYSVQSSREPTPRASSFNQADFYAMFSSKTASPKHGCGGDAYSTYSSKVPTPRASNLDDNYYHQRKKKNMGGGGRSMSGELFNVGLTPSYPPPMAPVQNPPPLALGFGGSSSGGRKKEGGAAVPGNNGNGNNKELHMFVWSSSASPASEGNVRQAMGNRVDGCASADFDVVDSSKAVLQQEIAASRGSHEFLQNGIGECGSEEVEMEQGMKKKKKKEESMGGEGERKQQMPPASVMTRLILIMVWRKLIRNPNTYSSVLGLVWSFISFRWDIKMPSIASGSISILSDAGLGMAMFSLGLFMALQPKIIACGKSVAVFSMAVRFLTGPAVIAATSIAIGLRGPLLHAAIVQAALPQGIVPFVFAKEYSVHADILSTAVIFGMLIALPITILYYVLLGL